MSTERWTKSKGTSTSSMTEMKSKKHIPKELIRRARKRSRCQAKSKMRPSWETKVKSIILYRIKFKPRRGKSSKLLWRVTEQSKKSIIIIISNRPVLLSQRARGLRAELRTMVKLRNWKSKARHKATKSMIWTSRISKKFKYTKSISLIEEFSLELEVQVLDKDRQLGRCRSTSRSRNHGDPCLFKIEQVLWMLNSIFFRMRITCWVM